MSPLDPLLHQSTSSPSSTPSVSPSRILPQMSTILAPSPTSTSFLTSLESVDMRRFRSFLASAHLRALKNDTPRLVVQRKNKKRKVQDDHTALLEPISEKPPLESGTVADDAALSYISAEGKSVELVQVGEEERSVPSTPVRWNLVPATPPMTPEASSSTDSTSLPAPPSPVFYATSFLYPSTTDVVNDPGLSGPGSPSARDEIPEERDVMSGASKKMYLIPSMASSQTLPRLPTSDSRSTLTAGPPSPSIAVEGASPLEVQVLGGQGAAKGLQNDSSSPHQTDSYESLSKVQPFSTRPVSIPPSLHPRAISSVSLTGVPPVCLEGPSASFLAAKLSTFKNRVRHRWGSEGAIGDQFRSNQIQCNLQDYEVPSGPRHVPPPPVAPSSSSVYRVESRSRWSESSSEHLAAVRLRAAEGKRESAGFKLPWTRGRGSSIGSSEIFLPRTFWGKAK